MRSNLAISTPENKDLSLKYTPETFTKVVLENLQLQKENTKHLQDILRLEREAHHSRQERIKLKQELANLYTRLGEIAPNPEAVMYINK